MRDRPPRGYFDREIPEFKAVVALGMRVVPCLVRAIKEGDPNEIALSIIIEEITKRKFSRDEVYDKNGMKKRKDIWIEWWKHGRKEDVKRFDNLYKKLRKSIEKKKVRDSDSAKNAIQDLGVNVLPLIVAKIRDGDIDLIECVSVLTSNEVSKNASKKDVLVWWEKNKGRWLLSFKDQ